MVTATIGSSRFKRTMLCLVCGDTASGIHYGVLSCEGCKGFFRRLSIKSSFEIIISLKTRNHCQPCRLRRCLELGMSREAAKLGRRSRKTWKHLDLSIALHGQHLGEVEDGGSLPATAAASAPGGIQNEFCKFVSQAQFVLLILGSLGIVQTQSLADIANYSCETKFLEFLCSRNGI
ncbi:unnamed protein product [Mesocestoides corti]|uniref:Nuclear receptor domain-containing protein n=1 Tax=Mesocestoides corti TaxID=53468 RepID=A0A3P6HM52_MESCO|nr:unnamed protein product [Mesocestoides corti]